MAEEKKSKPQLHEIIAVEAGLKGQKDKIVQETLNDFRKKHILFEGFTRSYEPINEDGDTFPDEVGVLETTVPERLDYTKAFWAKYVDNNFSKASANCEAKADLIVDGTVVAEGLPVSFLLDLEKDLKQFRATLDAIPTLDNKLHWTKDDKQDNVWKTDPQVKFSTKKVTRAEVVVPPTDRHPAQVKEYTEDVRVGKKEEIKFSGRIPSIAKSQMLGRCDDLIQATQKARTRANRQEVDMKRLGAKLHDLIVKG
jgi:hypothetical protein